MKKLHRRSFLRGALASTALLPLLPSLARGQSTTFPQRFIVFFTPNGTLHDEWFPEPGVSETDFTLRRILLPLEAHKADLLITRGIDMASIHEGPGEPHQKGMGGLLTGWHLLDGDMIGGDGSLAGWGRSISLDQLIANHIGATTPVRSLELGVRSSHPSGMGEVRNRLSYLGPEQPLSPEDDPRVIFDRLFSSATQDQALLAAQTARRRSVLDAVRQQFATLTPRLGHEDRMKLETHTALVRDLEQRLEFAGTIDDHCTVPTAPAEIALDDENQMPALAEAQIDLLVAGMACDVTRVATLQFSNAENHVRFPWLDSLGDGHSLSHAGPSNEAAKEERVARGRWYAERFAYLLERLKSVPEGEGTLLDNTVVLWVNELSLGNTHDQNSMPFLLAGRGGGAIRTGRYVQYVNASHCDLLTGLAHAFGVEQTVGNPDYATGPLSGLS
jgi:hypothetical protein